MIPKIIHYCWLSDDPMPEESVKYIENWKKILPDYEFVLWNRSRFDIDSVAWVREAFNLKKYAFAADYIRLYAVYNYGGIYLDTDIEVVKKFDDLLEQPLMLAYESKRRNGIEAGCFGAEKGSAFVGSCLKHYDERYFLKKDGSVDTETLPMIMQSAMQQWPNLFVYPWCYFTAKNQETGKIEKNDFTYSIHHFAGSWLSGFERDLKQLSVLANDKHRSGIRRKLYIVLKICILRFKYFGIWRTLIYYLKNYVLLQDGINPLKKLLSFFK